MIKSLKGATLLLTLSASACIASAQLDPAPPNPPTDLRTLEHKLSATYHLNGQHVPMMGLVSGIAHIASRGGVSSVRVVTYDVLPGHLNRTGIAQLARTHLGDAWSLLVRERSGTGSEDNMVWVQPFGHHVRLLVVTPESNELNLVQMELSPDALKHWEQTNGQLN